MQIGLLRHVFISRGIEWLVCLSLALLPLTVAVILSVYCLNNADAGIAWFILLISLGITGALWGLARWYLLQRKFFCICENGCAFGKKLRGQPNIMPWTEIEEIKLEEDAYLHEEENTFWGLKVSSTVEEKSRQWLAIRTKAELVRFNLKDFPEHDKLMDQLLEHSRDVSVNLAHERIESPELQAAKASGKQFGYKKTVFYAIGIVIMVLFIVLRIVVKFNR